MKLLITVVFGLLAGCATGPKYGEVKSAIPSLKATEGRIFFYRSGNPFGSGIQPAVMLNGSKVGDSTPGGFFFVDRVAGAMDVTMSTEVERKATFTLAAGQVRYVRMSVGLGVIVYRVYPELVDAATAQAEIADLSYIGHKLVTSTAIDAGPSNGSEDNATYASGKKDQTQKNRARKRTGSRPFVDR